MILSNAGLHAALDAGDLVITPEPGPRRPTAGQRSCPYDTCSVNLRLGPQISIPKPGRPITLDLRRGGIAAFLPELYETTSIDETGGYALATNKFILARTLERVSLPIREGRPCYAARIEGRSSFARVGLLVHFTARPSTPDSRERLPTGTAEGGTNAVSLEAERRISKCENVPF